MTAGSARAILPLHTSRAEPQAMPNIWKLQISRYLVMTERLTAVVSAPMSDWLLTYRHHAYVAQFEYRYAAASPGTPADRSALEAMAALGGEGGEGVLVHMSLGQGNECGDYPQQQHCQITNATSHLVPCHTYTHIDMHACGKVLIHKLSYDSYIGFNVHLYTSQHIRILFLIFSWIKNYTSLCI